MRNGTRIGPNMCFAFVIFCSSLRTSLLDGQAVSLKMLGIGSGIDIRYPHNKYTTEAGDWEIWAPADRGTRDAAGPRQALYRAPFAHQQLFGYNGWRTLTRRRDDETLVVALAAGILDGPKGRGMSFATRRKTRLTGRTWSCCGASGLF